MKAGIITFVLSLVVIIICVLGTDDTPRSASNKTRPAASAPSDDSALGNLK